MTAIDKHVSNLLVEVLRRIFRFEICKRKGRSPT